MGLSQAGHWTSAHKRLQFALFGWKSKCCERAGPEHDNGEDRAIIIVVGYLDAHLRPEHSPIRPDQRYRQKHTVIVSLVAYMSISNNSNYDIRSDVLRKANQFIDYWASV